MWGCFRGTASGCVTSVRETERIFVFCLSSYEEIMRNLNKAFEDFLSSLDLPLEKQ